MKTLIILFIAFSFTAQAGKIPIGTGYIVSANVPSFEVFKTSSPDSVNAFASSLFCRPFVVENELKNSRFYDLRTETIHFYVEKKRLFLKKNGKIIYKKFKN